MKKNFVNIILIFIQFTIFNTIKPTVQNNNLNEPRLTAAERTAKRAERIAARKARKPYQIRYNEGINSIKQEIDQEIKELQKEVRMLNDELDELGGIKNFRERMRIKKQKKRIQKQIKALRGKSYKLLKKINHMTDEEYLVMQQLESYRLDIERDIDLIQQKIDGRIFTEKIKAGELDLRKNISKENLETEIRLIKKRLFDTENRFFKSITKL